MGGFSIGGAVNGAAAWVGGAPVVGGVLRNPAAVALLITALAAVIVLGVAGKPVKGPRRTARAFVYLLVAVTAVMCAHSYLATRSAAARGAVGGIEEACTVLNDDRISDGAPVAPRYGGGPRDYRDPRDADAPMSAGGVGAGGVGIGGASAGGVGIGVASAPPYAPPRSNTWTGGFMIPPVGVPQPGLARPVYHTHGGAYPAHEGHSSYGAYPAHEGHREAQPVAEASDERYVRHKRRDRDRDRAPREQARAESPIAWE